MFTVLSRIVQYGFKNFVRNVGPSTATVAIMALALLMTLGLIFFNVITDRAVASVQDKIDISVYFKSTTPEDEILNIQQLLKGLPEVKQVEYVSSDRALEIFKETHKEDQTITQAVNELNSNPLVASLNIKAKRPDQYASIAQYLQAPNIQKNVDNVNYAKNQVVIDRLTGIINNVNSGGLALTIALAIIASLVVYNTIRLAIYSNRDEIGIMRAVGASNAFVRGPYVFDGILAGIFGAVVSIILVAPILYFVSPYLNSFIPGLDMSGYFYANLPKLLGYQLIFGVLIGALSSFVAVKRYLKN